jgi:hypothetical protein
MTLSLSKVFSNFSSICALVSIKSTKLEGDLQLILRALGQFLLTNIHLSKFSYCKRHFLKLIRIPIKDKILSVSIWDPTIHTICLAH